MQRRIRYTRSADGTDIAWWSMGSGPPLLYLSGNPLSHVEIWDLPACQDWYRRLARRHTVVRFDPRGTGLSQRDVRDWSLGARIKDLEAVVRAAGIDRPDVFGATDGGAVALAYAARHPERLRRLVLWCAISDAADLSSPRLDAWRSLLAQDWGLMSDTCAHLVFGFDDADVGKLAAAALRRAVSADGARALLEANASLHVRDLLPEVRTPVLVLHRSDIDWLPLSVARAIATRLPDADLAVLPGHSTAPWLGDVEQAEAAMSAFLGGIEVPVEDHDVELTPREREVLSLLASGLANKEIAARLFVSVRTVERHVGNIYDKTGARGRAQATAWALRQPNRAAGSRRR